MTGKFRNKFVVFGAAAAMVASVTIGADSAVAAVTIAPTTNALTLSQALAADPATVTGASFVTRPPSGVSSTAIAAGTLAEFPRAGSDFAIMSTGDPRLADDGNFSGSSGNNLGGGSRRGNTDRDVTILKTDLAVPAGANCLTIEFRFFSEEYPEYVGSSFNDAFIAELDTLTWRTSGSAITAPGNFAFDPLGDVISINAAGDTSMTRDLAAGTTYDGATAVLGAATPITPGAHSLYLSIFDQADNIYDSAAFLDNLKLTHVNSAAQCQPGAGIVDHRKFVGLGDSYSSGFGVSPYEFGTHGDNGPNDCQRSTDAYAPEVAEDLGLDLNFHACQGGVTKDFYEPRNSTWGELAQLDYLEEDTGLVTFSMGGNDAKFSKVLLECVLGFELLPFNTCYNDEKVTKPVAEAFARLDNRASTPTDIYPYDTIFKDIRHRSPYATTVAVGYPSFYKEGGGDRTFLPGGRCEGVKKADQRWVIEKIKELNQIINNNAKRNGYLFANPNERFRGHELCGDDDEWFFPALNAGKYHPTRDGQRAMADEVIEQLENDGYLHFLVQQNQTYDSNVFVGPDTYLLSLVTSWPGSDVVMTLTSPSGRVITRSTNAPDVFHDNGAVWEQYEVTNPEPGEWKVSLFGADVAPGGEDTTLSVFQQETPNVAPTAVIDWRIDNGTLFLDGSGSSDVDGTIASHDWYISIDGQDYSASGATTEFALPGPGPFAVTLVVEDNDGAAGFADRAITLIDIKPGNAENTLNPASAGVTEVAILSTATFDATAIDPGSLRFGPGAAPVAKGQQVRFKDVNGDGYADLTVKFGTVEAAIEPTADRACVTGVLPDGVAFQGCDVVRVVPVGRPS